jgi:UDP-N-acetyl-D-galactosamine dehydrogenase
MINELKSKDKLISVIGLGYVGLPLALEFAKHFKVIGFDINQDRIEMMQNNIDPSEELDSSKFENTDILFTSDPNRISDASFHIIAVPTDINDQKLPNLTPLRSASKVVGQALKKGDLVVYESTVYPGCTEEECLPILEEESGLKVNEDFDIGYSPERIVPGDKVRTLTKILKIVSGSSESSLEIISDIYSEIIEPGVYKASTIKVAEAAKVIENTQRDINISLMNELAIIFDKLDIDTREVIKAAGTKWNFHQYTPGLVGGHCISVDPFYLMYKAREVGHEPQVIAAGRNVNDFIPQYIAKTMIQKLISKGKNPGKSKVLIKGITFKENVSDIRNSKVVDLAKELMSFSVNVHIEDPYASSNHLAKDYKLSLIEKVSDDYDGIIVAVSHREYDNITEADYIDLMNSEPILFDLKAMYPVMTNLDYWRL